MDDTAPYNLPEWGPLVLSYAKEDQRGALDALLRLDENLARIVRSVSEPALGQLRLAWWRDEILRERAAGSAPPPDPLLRSILDYWHSERSECVALIDGWEHLLFEFPLDDEARTGFRHGRARAFAALAKLAGHQGSAENAASHGEAWAAAELGMMGHETREHTEPLPQLPRDLRSLAIIGGLARRSIKRGGAPLFGDRLSPLAAMRLGIFGS
ncbi:squalene/phytoene synthase family protein [Qipengyuania sp. 1NDH17]|uniref:Squalene/phytoene synthase family protein n=1 Tax=Qipengyuania polymorpha TaxID=2867234 RepID=A0ABS7IVC3_9SPHN|nr:squalene/phytoene synthase family protein [Qipengyuania polymorpha]MBX7457402.1 squalene/phytoene synthase family protein [Qipengyuania polymorpha]